jgi:hypothetical protein
MGPQGVRRRGDASRSFRSYLAAGHRPLQQVSINDEKFPVETVTLEPPRNFLLFEPVGNLSDANC